MTFGKAPSFDDENPLDAATSPWPISSRQPAIYGLDTVERALKCPADAIPLAADRIGDANTLLRPQSPETVEPASGLSEAPISKPERKKEKAKERDRLNQESKRNKALRFNYISMGESWLPGSVRTLSTPEAVVVMEKLKEVAVSKAPEAGIAALLALTGISSRSFEALVMALQGEPVEHFSVDLANGTWTTTLAEHLCPRKPSEQKLAQLDRTSRSMTLPMPRWLVMGLQQIDNQQLTEMSSDGLESFCDFLQGFVPRFSRARLRTLMPSQIAFQCQDVSLAQALAGDRLGPNRSDASLNYFSIWADRCEELYRATMEPFVGVIDELDRPVAIRFGMENPAIAP